MFTLKLKDQSNLSIDSLSEKIIDVLLDNNIFIFQTTGVPQESKRINIPKKCYSVLNPVFGQTFYVVLDGDSVLVVDHVLKTNRNKVLSTIKFGSGLNERKNRLRLNKDVTRLLGNDEVGFTVVKYGKSVAVKVSPVSMTLLFI